MRLARDPALMIIGLVAPLVAFLLSFAPLDPRVSAAINAVVVAAAGIAVSVIVVDNRLAPAIAGLAQALVSLSIALGFDLTPEQQAGFLTIVGLATAAWLRTQVTAPVDEFGEPRNLAHLRAVRRAAAMPPPGSAAA